MKKIVLIVVYLLFGSLVKAQINLVANGSFEQYSHCPNSIGEVDSCISWFNVENTPDYCNACADSTSGASLPTNYSGTQMPFEGNGYIGLYTYNKSQLYREIVGTQLLDTLIIGNTYHVSIRVSRGNVTINNYACGASNKLGMRFTTYSYSLSNYPPINNYAQLYEDSIITDTLNWVLLAWNYTPDSAYTNVYIGNFFDDAHTDTISIANNEPVYYAEMNSYYYIDSVNIFCTDVSCSNGIPAFENDYEALRFDNNSNSIYLLSNHSLNGKLKLINTLGQTIEVLQISNSEQVNLSNLKEGLYIALFQSDKTTLTKKIIIQK